MPWLTTKKHPNYLIRNVISHAWPYEITHADAQVLPFEKSRFATLSLQWRHTSIMAPEVTVHLTICSIACHDWEQTKYPSTLIEDEIICNTEIAFWSIVITVTPHERHEVSNPQPLDCLLNSISWLKAKVHQHSLIGDIIICNTEITFCSIVITVSSHERHGIPNHSPLDNFLNGMSWLRAKETSTHFNWEWNHL